MSNQPDILGHIIEMKEAIARVEQNTQNLPERVTVLEHKHLVMGTQIKTVGAMASVFGAFTSWVLSQFWKA